MFWLCLSSPDDCRVKLTGVQVDEAKGDGDGKLPCHAQNDGQHLDVLWRRGKTLRSENNSYIPAPPPLPMFYGIITNMLGGHKCVWRTKSMNLCNKSAEWRSECTTDIQPLCFPSPLLSVFFQSHCWLSTRTSWITCMQTRTTGNAKTTDHSRPPCGVLFSENLFDFLTTAKSLSSISCLYQCSPWLLQARSTLFRDLKCPHGHMCV